MRPMNRMEETFAALRFAPSRDRLRLARAIVTLPQGSFASRASVAANCEINSLAEFHDGCLRLAAALGLPGKKPAAEHVGYLESLLQRSEIAPGVIGSSEWFFISAFISGSRAGPGRRDRNVNRLFRRAAGVRTDRGAGLSWRSGRRRRIDHATNCLVAPAEPVGFEIPRLLPKHPQAVRVHAGCDSRIVRELFAPGELCLAFIDGSHQHPYPLLDVLHLAPSMRPGGWLLLHDTVLGTRGEEMRARGEPLPHGAPYGAEWLFQRWPFPKINGGNIGGCSCRRIGGRCSRSRCR
jgi:hypothetical protein